MRRVFLVMTAVTVMAALMVVMAAPAFAVAGDGKPIAVGGGKEHNHGAHGEYDRGNHGLRANGTHGCMTAA